MSMPILRRNVAVLPYRPLLAPVTWELSSDCLEHARAARFDGQIALQAAAGSGHLEIVEQLIGAGSDVNAPGSHGITALYAARYFRNQASVEILL
jgi:hypothetical protein